MYKIKVMNEQILNLRLVQEVEKRPFLYNYKLPQYTEKRVTKRGWTEVGKTVNLTESHAKEKWRNLRTVFSRHLKAISSGTKKKYYLADAMQFAIPYIKRYDNFDKHFAKTSPKETQPSTFDEDDNSLGIPLSPIESLHLCPSNSPSPGPSVLDQKRKPRTSFSEVDQNFTERLWNQNEKMETSRNPREMFLLSLLPELDALDQFQMNTFKRRVLALIDDIVYSS